MSMVSGKRWFTWPRLACLAVTVVILVIIFRNIGSAAFLAALRQMQIGWFVLGFVSYGAAIWLGSLRWHFALRLTDRAIHLSASSRLFLIGHFFFVVLFGAAGGDLAKSAVYARYYRFALPEVIAAAPLDRVFGLGGNILLAIVIAAVTVWNGGFEEIRRLDLQWPGLWFLLAVVLLVLAGIGIIFWHPTGESSWARAIRALRSGGARMVVTPRMGVPGVLIAMLAMSALTAVIAFNLRAVSHASLPWGRLVWTFPAITLLGSLPFTVAGAGVREVAALTFLGLYGVPPGECVAVAMLTLVQKAAWGGIGAFLFWREEVVVTKRAGQPAPQTISIVIPTINEAATLPETVRRARALPEVQEIIVVDGGSQDDTRDVAEKLGCIVLSAAPGRGGQMKIGAGHAKADVVMLLHADTWLPPHAGQAALNCLRDRAVVAGGFWKVFQHTPLLLLGSRWKCAVRLLLGRRLLGDQAIFIRRTALEEIGGVPDLPLMEDFELCRRLRRIGRLALAEATLITSARRFEKLGVLRTYLRMWHVTLRYRLGTSPQELRRLYEKK